MGGHHNRKMTSLLLDRRFQLKYTAMILGVAMVVSAALGSFLYIKVRENSRMLELEAAADAVFQTQLASADTQLLTIIAASFGAFLVVLTILSLFITHRMAGPIFVMRRHVATLASGSIPQVRALRKGDEFVEFYETLSDAVDAIQGRTEEEIAVLSRAVDALGGAEGPDAESARRALGMLVEKKRGMLDRGAM